jgi:hypothetical protein
VAGDTVLLLAGDSGEYFTLNDVGGRIWDLADGDRAVTDIVRALLEEYDAPEDVIQADALEILGQLSSEGLIDDAGAAA